MAVISKTLFEGITDRAAFQFQSINKKENNKRW